MSGATTFPPRAQRPRHTWHPQPPQGSSHAVRVATRLVKQRPVDDRYPILREREGNTVDESLANNLATWIDLQRQLAPSSSRPRPLVQMHSPQRFDSNNEAQQPTTPHPIMRIGDTAYRPRDRDHSPIDSVRVLGAGRLHSEIHLARGQPTSRNLAGTLDRAASATVNRGLEAEQTTFSDAGISHLPSRVPENDRPRVNPEFGNLRRAGEGKYSRDFRLANIAVSPRTEAIHCDVESLRSASFGANSGASVRASTSSSVMVNLGSYYSEDDNVGYRTPATILQGRVSSMRRQGSGQSDSRYRKASRYHTKQDSVLFSRPARSCLICLEVPAEFPQFRPTSRCTHESTICAPCIREYILHTVLHQSSTLMTCPDPECRQALEREDITRGAGGDQACLSRYESLLRRLRLEKDPDFVWCKNPSCNWGQIHRQRDAAPVVTCESCHARSCFTHDVPWHTGLTCAKYDDKIAETRAIEERANQLYLEQYAKTCPNPSCGRRIEKAEGCDHMTCRRPAGCGHEFCWICLADYRVIFDEGSHHHAPSCRHYVESVAPRVINLDMRPPPRRSLLQRAGLERLGLTYPRRPTAPQNMAAARARTANRNWWGSFIGGNNS